MWISIILMMQAGTAAASPDRIVLPLVKPCGADPDPEEVVVCARGNEQFRLRPLPPRPERSVIPKAETRLFGQVVGAVEAEQVGLDNGMQSKRMMLKLKMPF